MNSPGPTVDSASIRRPEAAWLSDVLGTRITWVDAEVIGANRGFVSTTWKLRLQGEPAGSAPERLVLKSETANPLMRSIGRQQRSFERETSFYRELAPHVGALLPKVHACGTSPDDCWLLMEDLSHLRAGDQVRGLSQLETRAVVRRIAALHAHFWMNPELLRMPWLPAHTFWFQQPDPSLLEPFLRDYGLRLQNDVERLIRAVLEQEQGIDAALAERPWSLVHGDLRADNLLFGGDQHAPTAMILDWATTTRSMAAEDLSFLVGGSEPVAERMGHLDELLYLWQGELAAHGVRDYSAADARHDLQLATLRCLSAVIKFYGMLIDPEVSVRTALFNDQAIQRHAAAILELRAWEALPEPLDPTG